MTKVRVGGKSTVRERGTIRPGVQSIVAGTGISVDVTDPQNPTVSATGGGGGSGDVTGPASSTDNNFPQFNGTTGKVIKNSTYGPSSFDPAGSSAAALTSANSYTDTKVLDSIVYAVALG